MRHVVTNLYKLSQRQDLCIEAKCDPFEMLFDQFDREMVCCDADSRGK
jgi:hypothetical protein